MCDPNGKVCSYVEGKLRSRGIGPDSSPLNHPDMVLEIAQCAAKKSGYTTYYPYRSMGWAGFKEFAVKDILIRNGWTFVERKSPFDRARFLSPSQ
jgi:hypothetical protein